MKKTAFMFPGQGSQFVGMIQDITHEWPAADAVFRLARELSGEDIARLCFEGPEEALNLTENTQPCLLTAEYAVLAAVREAGVTADAYVGFSLGEWTALTAAGVVSFSEALQLVRLRAAAMQEAVPVGQGGMAVILGRTEPEIEALCREAGGYVAPSNFNCPGQISVAGESAGIDSLMALAEQKGYIAKRIAVSIPSHCALMKPASEKLAEAIAGVDFRAPDRPIVMNFCAEAVTEVAAIRENVIRQLTNPVRMEASIDLLLEQGFEAFVELGPGNTLTRFIQKCAKAKGKNVETYTSKTAEILSETIRALTED